MLRTKSVESRRYPSFGKCIFCGTTEDLTDEHIVPEALTGVGQLVIELGSCRQCNNYANENYEQAALNADFAPVRHMLDLRRKRRGKKTKPRRLPLVSYTASIDEVGNAGFDQELPVENYPPLYQFVVHEPAGKLVGIDRSNGATQIRVGFLHLGLKRTTPNQVTTRLPMIMGGPEMVVAKMAYCYAVAEKGLDVYDARELVDLLMGRRHDVFNFVGSPVEDEHLAMLRLHKFYFRMRGNLNTVIVHLFASFGGPKHEVVIGPDR